MIDVIVTGSRDLRNEGVVHDFLDQLSRDYGGINSLVEGGCPTGADSFARSWQGYAKHRTTIPAQWTRYGKSAGPRRNQEMVDLYPSAVLAAFPIGKSTGTRDCIRRAEAAGLDVHIIEVELTPALRHLPDWSE